VTRSARALLVALLAAGCAAAAPPVPAGPARPAQAPPAASAPGFHAVTPSGVEVVYDPARRAYAVPEAPGTFWLDGRYFRRSGDAWQTSAALDGPWSACAPADLPAGLRAAP